MAKGTITFEFDSVDDLFRQMLDVLAGTKNRDVLAQCWWDLYANGPTKTKLPELPAPVKAEVPAETPKTPEPPVTEPEKPAPEQAAEPQSESQPDRTAETVTLETLSSAPYPDLLDFCRRHPETRVDADKNAAPFFRPLVESRIKNYLESQVK